MGKVIGFAYTDLRQPYIFTGMNDELNEKIAMSRLKSLGYVLLFVFPGKLALRVHRFRSLRRFHHSIHSIMPRYQDPLAELSGSDSDSAESDAEKELSIEAARAQKKRKQADKIDLQTLQQHGYKSGPSVLFVPAPQQAEQSWEWASGKDANPADLYDRDAETTQEREQTRAAATTGAEAAVALSQKAMQQNFKLKADKCAEQQQMAHDRRQTYQQKEKRKRDMGQAKSAKNYVEEEKRLARNFGMYSGFDT